MQIFIFRQCADNMDETPVNGDLILKPALTPSLFPNMPLTVYFGTQDEKGKMCACCFHNGIPPQQRTELSS